MTDAGMTSRPRPGASGSPADVAQARAALATPPGEAGSGRLRYGAAMTLWQAGLLSVETLEVYRICALLDHEDPAGLLAARGLAPPARAGDLSGEQAVLSLMAEADAYLATMPGPGVAEVRQGIATALARLCGPPATANPIVEAHLPAALAALRPTHPALATAIGAAAPCLDWITYDEYPRDEIGEAFASGHAFASLIGATGPFDAGDFDFGLFLIAPHVLYRDHAHRAPELYAPLTGPHGWRFAPGAPLVVKPAHVPVWNDPFAPHLTKVGPVPFLCLFGWTRDVNDPARVVWADDWAELEALRISDAG